MVREAHGGDEVTTHHQLTAEDLFVVADEVVEGLKELDHALVLLQCGVLLKRLLDQLPQLLGLGRIRETRQRLTNIQRSSKP